MPLTGGAGLGVDINRAVGVAAEVEGIDIAVGAALFIAYCDRAVGDELLHLRGVALLVLEGLLDLVVVVGNVEACLPHPIAAGEDIVGD